MSRYLVKEIFGPTIQGEGAHAGRPCVFLRFAVCNLSCSWCDTDFEADGAESMTVEEIVERLVATDIGRTRLVVVSGGEPTLHWDEDLARAVREVGFTIHMETNGTRELKAAVDWLTVSPKPQFHDGRFHLLTAPATRADECKVVVDDTVDIDALDRFRTMYECQALSLQPCMGDDYERHLARTLELLHQRPEWRLSLQLHKILGVP